MLLKRQIVAMSFSIALPENRTFHANLIDCKKKIKYITKKLETKFYLKNAVQAFHV